MSAELEEARAALAARDAGLRKQQAQVAAIKDKSKQFIVRLGDEKRSLEAALASSKAAARHPPSTSTFPIQCSTLRAARGRRARTTRIAVPAKWEIQNTTTRKV